MPPTGLPSDTERLAKVFSFPLDRDKHGGPAFDGLHGTFGYREDRFAACPSVISACANIPGRIVPFALLNSTRTRAERVEGSRIGSIKVIFPSTVSRAVATSPMRRRRAYADLRQPQLRHIRDDPERAQVRDRQRAS